MLYHKLPPPQSRNRGGLPPVHLDVEQLRSLRSQGRTLGECATHFRCSKTTVHALCHRHEIPTPPRSTPSPEKIQECLSQGWSIAKIALTWHCRKDVITAIIEKHGLVRRPVRPAPPPRRRRGPVIPVADRDKIATLVSQAWTQREIGEVYKVTAVAIGGYCKRHGIGSSNGRGRTLGRGRMHIEGHTSEFDYFCSQIPPDIQSHEETHEERLRN